MEKYVFRCGLFSSLWKRKDNKFSKSRIYRKIRYIFTFLHSLIGINKLNAMYFFTSTGLNCEYKFPYRGIKKHKIIIVYCKSQYRANGHQLQQNMSHGESRTTNRQTNRGRITPEKSAYATMKATRIDFTSVWSGVDSCDSFFDFTVRVFVIARKLNQIDCILKALHQNGCAKCMAMLKSTHTFFYSAICICSHKITHIARLFNFFQLPLEKLHIQF